MYTKHNNLYTSPATCIIKAIIYARLGGDMKRYTETELEKIVRIGKARIDQVIERACAELESVKPRKPEFVGVVSRPDHVEAQRQANAMYSEFMDRMGIRDTRNPWRDVRSGYEAGCRNANGSGGAFGGLLGGLGA